jgi:hypothetical protein
MKNLTFKAFLFLITILFVTPQIANTQCTGDSWDFNEDDFAAGNISATEAGNMGPIMTDMIDLNMDGTMDVMNTYEAIVFNPNANGTCDDGDFNIQASWGGASLPLPGPSSGSDFGGSTSDDCICEQGIIVMTVDMINGFNSDVANFEFEASSQNGSSEGYEYGFGFVTAATDATGNPITGLNTAAAVTAAISSYCNAEYLAGTTMSQHALSTALGAFTTQADDLNATTNNCATSSQSGEDTVSGSGPNSGLSTGVSGLNSTDLITQVTYIYGLSTAPGTDCDLDGDNGVGTNPSGSFAGISGCFAAPCGYSYDVATDEVCGEFTIDITNIVGTGAADPITMEAYDIIINGNSVLTGVTGNQQLSIAGSPAFVADGVSTYSIVLQLTSDATCQSAPLNITAPAGTRPNVPTFIPNNPTTSN